MTHHKPSLYGQYDRAVLSDWARRLRKFRFCHALGGHANDPDTLQARYRYEDETDLVALCAQMGISLTRYDVPPPQPELGKTYAVDAGSVFPSLVQGTRWIAQPGRCQIAQEDVFVWCDAQTILLSVGADYVITERDVRSAEAIEPMLAPFEARRIDPPLDRWHCICPKYHPEYFERE